MKISFLALTLALSAGSLAYTVEEPIPTPPIPTENYHCVSFGPDIFVAHFMKEKPRADWSIIANAYFLGMRLTYDYIKPKALYLGSDAMVAIGKCRLTNKFVDEDGVYKEHNNGSPLYANIEQRVGYTSQTKFSEKTTISRFAGMGWYCERSDYNSSAYASNWFYAAAGARMNHQFSDSCNLGLNLKAMYSFLGTYRYMAEGWKSKMKAHKVSLANMWGYEIGVPLRWQIGAKRRWDFEFQPYFLKLDIQNNVWIAGARLLANYHF